MSYLDALMQRRGRSPTALSQRDRVKNSDSTSMTALCARAL